MKEVQVTIIEEIVSDSLFSVFFKVDEDTKLHYVLNGYQLDIVEHDFKTHGAVIIDRKALFPKSITYYKHPCQIIRCTESLSVPDFFDTSLIPAAMPIHEFKKLKLELEVKGYG